MLKKFSLKLNLHDFVFFFNRCSTWGDLVRITLLLIFNTRSPPLLQCAQHCPPFSRAMKKSV